MSQAQFILEILVKFFDINLFSFRSTIIISINTVLVFYISEQISPSFVMERPDIGENVSITSHVEKNLLLLLLTYGSKPGKQQNKNLLIWVF